MSAHEELEKVRRLLDELEPPPQPSEAAILKAKENKKSPDIESLVDKTFHCRELYDEVLHGIASNVKMGPFTATSGVILPYYLNASTNFLDKAVAHKIARLFAHFLDHWLPKGGKEYVICGMEMAGGILASQLAVLQSSVDTFCDFLYVRKSKKTTGTAQQLEGPQKYTSRTSASPPVVGVWVDDALSTGQSMKDGILMLKKLYNIHIQYAVYLVDRNHDRVNLPVKAQHLADPVFDDIQITALYDLDQVDRLVQKPLSKS
eukprot:RCo019124